MSQYGRALNRAIRRHRIRVNMTMTTDEVRALVKQMWEGLARDLLKQPGFDESLRLARETLSTLPPKYLHNTVLPERY